MAGEWEADMCNLSLYRRGALDKSAVLRCQRWCWYHIGQWGKTYRCGVFLETIIRWKLAYGGMPRPFQSAKFPAVNDSPDPVNSEVQDGNVACWSRQLWWNASALQVPWP